MIELIMALLIIGVLSVFTAPRVLEVDQLKAGSVANEALAALSFAQRSAIAHNRRVWVRASRASLDVCYDESCSLPVAWLSGAPVSVRAPPGFEVTSSRAVFSFDAQGRLDDPRAVEMVFAGRRLRVEEGTGLAWSPS